jgi:hypothetical protein
MNIDSGTLQDAVLAAEARVDGILLSNHGGMVSQPPLSNDFIKLFFRSAIGIVSCRPVRLDEPYQLVLFSSMPPLEVLYKLRQKRPDIFDRVEGTRLTTDSGWDANQ